MALSKKELGNLIKEARKLKSNQINKRYTQRMLANDINKSQSYIGDIESGRTYPSYVLLNEIAKACGVSISFFDVDRILNNDIDMFIKLQLENAEDEHVLKIREALKNDPNTNLNYLYKYINKYNYKIDNKNYPVKTAEEMAKFFLMQPSIMSLCGIDTTKLSEDELSELIKDLLNQLKFIGYKYVK